METDGKGKGSDKNQKEPEYRDYFREASEASNSFFTLETNAEVRQHIKSLKDFVAIDLPEINKVARKYGPKLTTITRLANFLKSSEKALDILTKKEKHEVNMLCHTIMNAAVIKSQEQKSHENAQKLSSIPAPRVGTKRRYNGNGYQKY